MNLWDGIERLINEHGSATILRERLALARDEFEALEKAHFELKTDHDRLRNRVRELEDEVRSLKQKADDGHPNNPSATVCDHCGSSRLKRTGNRPDPLLGVAGVKLAIFLCLDCGRETSVMPDLR